MDFDSLNYYLNIHSQMKLCRKNNSGIRSNIDYLDKKENPLDRDVFILTVT